MKDRCIVFGNALFSMLMVTGTLFAGPPCNDGVLFPNIPTYDAGNGPQSVATVDLNGDGIFDLAVANEFSDDVSVLLGNGDGTFQPEQSFAVGEDPKSIATGDLDGDGVPDLAIANQTNDDISVLLGSGDGTFLAQMRFDAGFSPRSLTIGDLDNDGNPDVAVANLGDDDISILLGNGDGTFQPQQRFDSGDAPRAIEIGDLDGDGALDLAAVNLSSDDISVLIGNSDGTFQPEQRFGVGDAPLSLVIRDLDGDGVPDLAVTNGSTDDVSVLIGNGDGTYQTDLRFDVGDAPRSVAIDDLDGDSAPDVVVVNGASDDMSILLGNGNGTFQSQLRYAVGEEPKAVTIRDLNGDGIPDLTVANERDDNVIILLGNGDGTAQADQRISAGDVAQSVAIGDLDGDGIPDLSLANEATDDVSVLLGNGDGTFQAEQRFGAGDFANFVAIGDFNADGSPDLAVANGGNQGGIDNDVSILLGNGDGTFQPEQRFGTGDTPVSIAIDDLDGDGALDLALANRGGDVSVLLGNGDGTFLTQQRFGAGIDPFSVAIGDLDGDGIPDLTVANLGGADVSVLLGNGDGTFQPEQRFGAGVLPASVAIGDLNNDGNPDLAVANIVSDDVSVLLGNGDGTFQAEQRFDGDNGTRSISIGDFDGDGALDLAVANQSSDNVSVLVGNGDGTFQTQQLFDAGDEPRSVAIGDLDGDGAPDLVIANTNSNDLSVLLNSTLSTTFWSGDAGQVFTDSVNWAGTAPSIGAPNFAVFDATVPPGGFDPVENVLLPSDVTILGLAQSNQEIQLNLFGNDLVLLGDRSSSDGPLGLELGVEQCGGMDAFPPVPPTFRLDNGSASPSTLMTPRATIGRDGPAVLEINGGNGVARLDVVEDLIVGDVGDGAIVLRTSDAELTYGTSVDDTDSLIIGDRATGLVDVTNGASVSATAGLGRFFLGRAPGSEGTIRIDGAGSEWEHLVIGEDDLAVGMNGRGVIEITDGGTFDTQFSTITLARFPGSSAEVTSRGAGSGWFDPIAELIIGLEGEATVTVEDGGTLDIFSGITNGANGVVRGDGTLSEVVNLGAIVIGSTDPARGNAPGTLTVNGDYDQFDDPLNPEISGRVLIDAFESGGFVSTDMLSVTGEANLAGGLLVSSSAPLNPGASAPSPVLLAGSVNGRFDVAFLPGVTPDAEGNGRFLRIDYPMGDAANGTVTVDLFVDTLTGQIDTDNPEAFSVNGQPVAAAVGDLNDDQLIDLAVALPDPGNNGSVVVLYNAGSTAGVWNGFSGSAQITVGLDPSGIAIGDADRSGGLDIAVTNRGDDEAMIITNDGLAMPSSLTIAQTIPVGDAPTSIAFGDLDEDKWDDIAVANFGSDTVTVLQNLQGIGPDVVGNPQTLPAGDGPIDIVFGDLDEDKWDDVIVLNANDGTVTYLDNTFPPGTFDPPMGLAADAGPAELGLEDLDGDGINDLFSANPGADTVSIILGNGDSTFEPVVNLPLAGDPRSIAAVDLDDDNDLDLAIIADDGTGTNTIRVLRNDLTDGQLIFAPDADIDAGGEPLFVLAGDVDDDGQGDLITVNSTSGARSEETGAPAMPIGVVRQSAADALCPGDCDDNGIVEFNDLVNMLFFFGDELAPEACDADESGTVDFNDLVATLFVFGACP